MALAITINDTGGDYRAALNVVEGRSRVARLYLGLMKKVPPGALGLRRAPEVDHAQDQAARAKGLCAVLRWSVS